VNNMNKPSSSAPRFAPDLARKRWISPRQAILLESLWSGWLRRSGRRLRAQRSREEQWRHIVETVGRKVASARELSWREANRVIRRLLEEIRSLGASSAPADPSAAKTGSHLLNVECDAVRKGTASAVPQKQLNTGASAPEVRLCFARIDETASGGDAPAAARKRSRSHAPKKPLPQQARAKNERKGRGETQKHSHSKDKKLRPGNPERRTA